MGAWYEPPPGADVQQVKRGRALSWAGCGLMLVAGLVMSAGIVVSFAGFLNDETVLLVMGLGTLALGLVGGLVGMGLNWYGFAKHFAGWWFPKR